MLGAHWSRRAAEEAAACAKYQTVNGIDRCRLELIQIAQSVPAMQPLFVRLCKQHDHTHENCWTCGEEVVNLATAELENLLQAATAQAEHAWEQVCRCSDWR